MASLFRNSNSGPGCLSAIVFPFSILGDLIKSIRKSETRRSTLILVSSIMATCFVCFGAVGVMGAGGARNTPTPTVDINAINTKAMIKAWSSYTETAAALPTSTATLTPTPTITAIPTETVIIVPTSTNTPMPTATVIFIPPTLIPPTSARTGYDRNGDGRVTCADFSTQAGAQAAYRDGETQLDGNDNDGLACESLP